MHEDEELGGPFDVGEGAAAEFGVGVAVGAAGQAFVVDPGFHSADFPDGFLPHPAVGVAEVVDHGNESFPELLGAGDPYGPEEGLDFPGFSPLLVVAAVGFQGAHDWAGSAFGAESQVDVEGWVAGGFC